MKLLVGTGEQLQHLEGGEDCRRHGDLQARVPERAVALEEAKQPHLARPGGRRRAPPPSKMTAAARAYRDSSTSYEIYIPSELWIKGRSLYLIVHRVLARWA
jgi:hypothetical protein